MNLIMGRRQTKRQEPQCGPLHHQQQQQQSQNKHTPPPPPPPPPPPCADDSWELQYCKWWGWNWVKKDRSEMNKYAASSPCEGPTRDNLPPVRCPAMPIKRVDKNNNRFKDFCNCLFSPNRKTAESLQRLYSTPSNSLIYESLCCGNQERGLDSYTCMELRNRSNKNTPNKRSKDKICKCPQEQEKKEKRKKHCTCKDSISSLSNGCNCKEKEPPKKGCNCKESKVNAMRACNFKDSNSELPPQMCCNCKDSNNNLIKKCCECNETNCPKKCCCGCMEPSNVARKCCGCPPNPSNAVNCCGCPKKYEQGTSNYYSPSETTEKIDCPCQIEPETKCIPCQTADKTNACDCLIECTCCCHCTCRDSNARRCFPIINRRELTCSLCKERESKRLSSTINFNDDNRDPKQNIGRPTKDTVKDIGNTTEEYTKKRTALVTVHEKNHPDLLPPFDKTPSFAEYFATVPNLNLLMSSKYFPKNSKFYQQKFAHYAFTQQNCTNCKYCPPSAGYSSQPCSITRRCSAGCLCKWGRSPPDLDMRLLRATTEPGQSSGYWSSEHRKNELVQTQDSFPFAYPYRIVPRYFCCPNCGRELPEKEADADKDAEIAEVDKDSRKKSDEKEIEGKSDGGLTVIVDRTSSAQEGLKRKAPSFYQVQTEPTSTSFLPNPYKDDLEKERFLRKLQLLPNDYPRLKNTVDFNADRLLDTVGIDEETKFLKKLEKTIKKQLKSSVLEDIYSSLLSKKKKRVLELSSSSESIESKDDVNYLINNKRAPKSAKLLIDKILRQKTEKKNPKETSKSSSRRKKSSKKLKKATDSSSESSDDDLTEEHIENFNNLFDKIYKVTKKSSFNVEELHDTLNSLERKKHHRKKIKLTESELIEKLHEIAENSVNVEDTIQNVFDVLIRKNEPRRQSDDLEDLSSNSSSTSTSYHKLPMNQALTKFIYCSSREDPIGRQKLKLKSKSKLAKLKKGKKH